MNMSEREKAWTRYWRSGALHSCVGSYDGNYGGAVAAFWRERFRGLGRAARVLDLATGNAPVPALMLETLGADALPTIDAVDLASPRPSWLHGAAASRIRVQGGVRMEALPFDDASFDAVFSQFGFEYAERDAATRELVRVATPAALIALVCHHADSHLVAVARAQVDHTDWLEASGTHDRARALMPLAGGRGAGLRDAFNRALAPLDARARASSIPDALHDAGRAIARAVQLAGERGAAAGDAAMDAWVDATRDARLRSAELIECALDREAVDALASALEAAGHPAAVGELSEGDYLLGWTLVSR